RRGCDRRVRGHPRLLRADIDDPQRLSHVAPGRPAASLCGGVAKALTQTLPDSGGRLFDKQRPRLPVHGKILESSVAPLNLSRPQGGTLAHGQMGKQWRKGTRFAVYLLQIFPNVTEGLTMKRRGLIAFAAAGVIIGGAWLIPATAIRAQQQPAPA